MIANFNIPCNWIWNLTFLSPKQQKYQYFEIKSTLRTWLLLMTKKNTTEQLKLKLTFRFITMSFRIDNWFYLLNCIINRGMYIAKEENKEKKTNLIIIIIHNLSVFRCWFLIPPNVCILFASKQSTKWMNFVFVLENELNLNTTIGGQLKKIGPRDIKNIRSVKHSRRLT